VKATDDTVGDGRAVSVRQSLAGVLLGFVVLGGASVWGFIRQETFNDRQERQDATIEATRLAAAERSCDDAAETRRILRDMVLDGGVASGTAGGEALILTVTAASPEDIAAYRAHLTEQLTPALEQIVNELPDRRWDPGAGVCVDVETTP